MKTKVYLSVYDQTMMMIFQTIRLTRVKKKFHAFLKLNLMNKHLQFSVIKFSYQISKFLFFFFYQITLDKFYILTHKKLLGRKF